MFLQQFLATIVVGRYALKCLPDGPKNAHKYLVALEVKGVTAQDAGNYTVTAKNALGESNANIKLNFDSKFSSFNMWQKVGLFQQGVTSAS